MNFFELIKSSDSKFRRNLGLFLIAYFCVLFNYPLIRASSTTLFFEAFGAKSSPVAWLWGVLLLSITVFFSNKLQRRLTVQKVFLIASVVSFFIFLFSGLCFIFGLKQVTFLPFIWKEIYIVIQVHLLLAYSNNYFKKEHFKLLIGIVGGVGSIGGMLGGWLTSFAAHNAGTYPVMWIGMVFVLLPGFIFLGTQELKQTSAEKEKTPIASFTPGVGRYVATIAAIVALSQFIINIADFNFHIEFEKTISDATSRTSYLGTLYMILNGVTFGLQFILLPLIFSKVSEKNYHLFIPLSFLVLLGMLLLSPASGVVPLAIFFIYLKAADYSLFSAGKEILYQPLTLNQKYGAKYLTDMLVYRVAKALIAAVLIYLQTSFILNTLMVVFLLLWVLLIIKLFKLHRELFI
jgi:AAA family ATP:ADP antiporter